MFGLFGSFTSTAQVSAGVVSCSSGTGVCDLTLTNTGTAAATVNLAYSINVNGATGPGTTTQATVPAGGNVAESCTLTSGTGGSVGSQLVGTLILSNGGNVQFSGIWQA